jgi:hypothetical protein
MKNADTIIDKLLRALGVTRTRVTKNPRGKGKEADGEGLVVTEPGEAEVETAQPKHELVALYGFSANYPNNARLEFNPKSRREKGDLVFHTGNGFKIFLSWGGLAEARKRYATAAEQASDSIKRSLKNTRAKLEGTPETRSMKIMNHDATYTHARMFVERGGFPFGSSRVSQDAYAMHVHCDRSERYYVVYAFGRPNVSEELGKTIEPIMSSLKCH